MHTYPAPPDMATTQQWITWAITALLFAYTLWKAKMAQIQAENAQKTADAHGGNLTKTNEQVAKLSQDMVPPDVLAAAIAGTPADVKTAVEAGKAEIDAHAKDVQASLAKMPVTLSFNGAQMLAEHAAMAASQTASEPAPEEAPAP